MKMLLLMMTMLLSSSVYSHNLKYLDEKAYVSGCMRIVFNVMEQQRIELDDFYKKNSNR